MFHLTILSVAQIIRRPVYGSLNNSLSSSDIRSPVYGSLNDSLSSSDVRRPVYGLFNNSLSSSDYIAPNDGMIVYGELENMFHEKIVAYVFLEKL
jgi:hypothetical protein